MRATLLVASFGLVLACGRPSAPTPATDPSSHPGASSVAAADPVAVEVNGLSLTRAELEARVPATADSGARRRALAEVTDLLLAASVARGLEPYRDLPPLVAGERFLADQFAPARFCGALPDAELDRYYRAHRTRYVHPDHHVLAVLRAVPGDGPAIPAERYDDTLAATLEDAERTGADAFDGLSTRWETLCQGLNARPAAELWTFFSAPGHPERTAPARPHPEDTLTLVALTEGERTPVLTGDDGARVYVKLEGHPAARRDLRDPEVRADVRRRACDEHLEAGRLQFLSDLRREGHIVITPATPDEAR